jgi:hypothetical protein
MGNQPRRSHFTLEIKLKNGPILILGYIQLLETSIKIIEYINKESSFGVKSKRNIYI